MPAALTQCIDGSEHAQPADSVGVIEAKAKHLAGF